MRRDAIEEGRRWLEQAHHDLRWAEHLASEGSHYLACFLAQQVAEKALKAFLYAQGLETVIGRSVQRLGADAAAYDRGIGEGARRWSVLDGYYIPTPHVIRTVCPTASPLWYSRAKRPSRPSTWFVKRWRR